MRSELFGHGRDRARADPAFAETHGKSVQHPERPELPEKWRATYLMAPFTSGQLVVGDLIHDASLSAMRVRLFGLRSGALDLLIAGAETYLLSPTTVERRVAVWVIPAGGLSRQTG